VFDLLDKLLVHSVAPRAERVGQGPQLGARVLAFETAGAPTRILWAMDKAIKVREAIPRLLGWGGRHDEGTQRLGALPEIA
jgi:hypothetical protein